MDFIDTLTNGLTGAAEGVSELVTIAGEFVSTHPLGAVLALTVLVALVGWEATPPPIHPEED